MAAPKERLAPAPRRGGRSWLKQGFLVHLCATALIIAPLLLPLPVEAKIGLFFTEGVTAEDRDTAQKAIAATVRYFAANYQLHLKFEVRLVLVQGDPAFASALQRHCGIPTKDAAVHAKEDQGISCDDNGAEKILINVAGIPKARLILVVCHEIVHKFQLQESVPAYSNIHWLSEGVPNVIGAYVAESLGEGAVRRDRQIAIINNMSEARKFPSLNVLHSKKQWQAAMEKYGDDYTYKLAELAVYQLANLKGYKPLFQYFRYLRNYNIAKAFEMAFGLKLGEYEKYFDRLLAQKL